MRAIVVEFAAPPLALPRRGAGDGGGAGCGLRGRLAAGDEGRGSLAPRSARPRASGAPRMDPDAEEGEPAAQATIAAASRRMTSTAAARAVRVGPCAVALALASGRARRPVAAAASASPTRPMARGRRASGRSARRSSRVA